MSQDVQTFDLIIVGAGSGNMIPVPEMENWRLAIVEPDKFGGTCLNRGCIPSKCCCIRLRWSKRPGTGPG